MSMNWNPWSKVDGAGEYAPQIRSPFARYGRTEEWVGDQDDEQRIVVRIRCSKRDAKKALSSRRNKQEVIHDLVESGHLQEVGCDCTHCRNDWDCCGRMIVSHTHVTRMKRGLRVVQTLTRNV